MATARPDVTTLAGLISTHAPYDGSFDLRLANVHVIKVSRPSTRATHTIQHPSVCIVAQGAKSVMIGDDVYPYEGGQVAVYSVDIPVAAEITRATPAQPYLTLKIDLEPQKITDLAKRAFPNGLAQAQESRPLYIGDADSHLIDAAMRLITLMDRPANADLIAPLVIDEILIRLLVGPMGPRIGTRSSPQPRST